MQSLLISRGYGRPTGTGTVSWVGRPTSKASTIRD